MNAGNIETYAPFEDDLSRGSGDESQPIRLHIKSSNCSALFFLIDIARYDYWKSLV